VKAGDQTAWGCTRAVRSPGLGQVRLVVSCEHESLAGRAGVLVTNRADWSAANLIALDWPRWPTATFYPDSQGPLGVNAYRLRSAEALGTQWCLVFVASSLWHLTCRPPGPDRTQGRIQTIGDACRHPGRAVLQKLWRLVPDPLSQGVKADQVFARGFAKPRGRVPG
jgi:hypothetical protein